MFTYSTVHDKTIKVQWLKFLKEEKNISKVVGSVDIGKLPFNKEIFDWCRKVGN